MLLSWCLLRLLSSTLSLSSRLSSRSLRTVILAHGLNHWLLLLWLNDSDGIRQCLLRARLSFWVRTTHDLDLDTENTLSEQNVTGSGIDEVFCWLTGVDHETISELHALGTSSTQLSGHDNLATLSTALHDESEDTIACSANSETVEQLVSEGLALGDGGETAVLDLGGVQGDGVLGELEALLDEGGEFADSSSLLAENLLSVRGADDDVGDGGGDSDFDSRVSFLSKFTLEKPIVLSNFVASGDVSN